MKEQINSIRHIIESISDRAYDRYISIKYQIFFKGSKSLVDDILLSVKGGLATPFYYIGYVFGYIKGRYIVKRNK